MQNCTFVPNKANKKKMGGKKKLNKNKSEQAFMKQIRPNIDTYSRKDCSELEQSTIQTTRNDADNKFKTKKSLKMLKTTKHVKQ